jgi:hypothetical protein
MPAIDETTQPLLLRERIVVDPGSVRHSKAPTTCCRACGCSSRRHSHGPPRNQLAAGEPTVPTGPADRLTS